MAHQNRETASVKFGDSATFSLTPALLPGGEGSKAKHPSIRGLIVGVEDVRCTRHPRSDCI